MADALALGASVHKDVWVQLPLAAPCYNKIMLPMILAATLFTLGSDYRAAYQQFLLAKNQFQQYKTESTRLAAVTATRQILTARNKLWKAYLQNLRTQLATDTNIANYSQTTLYLNLETEINFLDKQVSEFSGLTSLSRAKQLSQVWEYRLHNSDQLTASARQQILSYRLDQFAPRLQPFIDQASPSSTLDLVRQKLGDSTTNLKQRHQLLLEAANLLLQLP